MTSHYIRVNVNKGEFLNKIISYCKKKSLTYSVIEKKEKKEKPLNSGKLWNDDELENVLSLYRGGMDIYDVSKEVGRSTYSIKEKLVIMMLKDYYQHDL